MSKLRFGLLGASWIARHALIDPAKSMPGVELLAVAARDPVRAAGYAQAHGIAHVAASYAALVSRDDIDVVFIGLTPSEHCRWTIAALDAGKHVLCEKPFAMNADEAKRMVAAAKINGRYLIEAWHYRFHPLMRRIEDICRSGVLGRLRRASARFYAPIPNTVNEFRWQGSLGGGALMDTGGYTIHVLRTLTGREPAVLDAASCHYGDVDLTTEARLDFGDGLQANIDCSMIFRGLFSELVLHGESGTLTVNGFPLPQWGCRLHLQTKDGELEETAFAGTTYQAQLDHVVRVINGESAQLTGGDDAIANMRVIDEIRRASAMKG